MKKYFLLGAMLFFVSALFGQQAEFYRFKLKNESPLRHKIYVEPFVNKGNNNDIDVNKIVTERFSTPFSYSIKGDKKTRNVNAWSHQKRFVPVDNPNDADVIISGTYLYNKGTETKEKLYKEKSGAYACHIPFSEPLTSNRSELTAIFKFQYKDNTSVTDTIHILNESQGGTGKVFKSVAELEEKSKSYFKSRMFRKYIGVVSMDDQWYKFKKIKIKDKALKEEFKSANQLIKEGKIKELGALYKKIYKVNPSKEVAHCIGMCYELLGNYPKALEYYKQLPDFIVKVRMKEQMKVFNYLQKMGMDLTIEEF